MERPVASVRNSRVCHPHKLGLSWDAFVLIFLKTRCFPFTKVAANLLEETQLENFPECKAKKNPKNQTQGAALFQMVVQIST